ncbi:hypothetical protein HII31_06592 [Pseudocercospora fuligena]|uniref:Uncharacterized protein n=1 Tax=Pseudocercospora fuligena TaxID=685502 RepID=A0A8H6RJJ1_9PEZI|nr:hypothetical protein HII31_06592 [Pseudocercospora fuligena]
MTDTREPGLRCPYFCCSNFNTQRGPRPDYKVDLKNRVHPIFHPTKLAGIYQIYDDADDRILIDQSLQLASQFMSMDTLYRHILTMAKGTAYFVSDDDNTIGKKVTRAHLKDERYEVSGIFVFPKPAHEIMDDRLRKQANAVIRDLAEMIDFEFLPPDSDGATGVCHSLEGPLPKHLHRKFPLGCRSLIVINSDVLENIRISESECHNHQSYKRSAQFDFAEVLCHETGHALLNAVYGDRWVEPCNGSAWASEGGYDLIAAIFGGTFYDTRWLIVPEGPHSRPVLEAPDSRCIMSWPSSTLVCQILCNGARIEVLDRPERFQEIFRLPDDFVANLFHENYWSLHHQHRRDRTLRPPDLARWIVALDKDVVDELHEKHFNDDENSELVQKDGENDDENGADSDDDLTTWLDLRLIDHDDDHLSDEAANRLWEVIRRQWTNRFSADPLDIMATILWPWNVAEVESMTSSDPDAAAFAFIDFYGRDDYSDSIKWHWWLTTHPMNGLEHRGMSMWRRLWQFCLRVKRKVLTALTE